MTIVKEDYRNNNFKWNMCVGYIVIAPGKDGETIGRVANEFGIKVTRLGYVVNGDRKVLMPFSEKGKQVVYIP